MGDHWNVRGDAHGWEEQLYPDGDDDEESAEGPTTE